MPTVRLSQAVFDELVTASREGETLEDAIVRLSGLQTDVYKDRASYFHKDTLRAYVDRKALIPSEVYAMRILEHMFANESYGSFQTHTDTTITTKSLQDKMRPQMEALKETHPKECEEYRPNVARWQSRIVTSLNQLRLMECITIEPLGTSRQHGYGYKLTFVGREIAKSHRATDDFSGIALAGSNVPVDDWEIPLALLGTRKHAMYAKRKP